MSQPTSGLTLDAAMRVIFAQVEPHTILAGTYAMMRLGFSPWESFSMLEKVCIEKTKTALEPARDQLTHDRGRVVVTKVTVLHDWRRCALTDLFADADCWIDGVNR